MNRIKRREDDSICACQCLCVFISASAYSHEILTRVISWYFGVMSRSPEVDQPCDDNVNGGGQMTFGFEVASYHL